MGADNRQSNEPETETRICQECQEPVDDPDAETSVVTSVVTLEYKNGTERYWHYACFESTGRWAQLVATQNS